MTSMLSKLHPTVICAEPDGAEILRQFMAQYNCQQAQVESLLERCNSLEGTIRSLEAKLEEAKKCRCNTATIQERCDSIWDLVCASYCAGNRLYSSETIKSFGNRVSVSEIVKNFGPGFQNSFPVGPGQAIRLEHQPRPGFNAEEISIDFSLANNANNYLDLEIKFFVALGKREGRLVGEWSGNEFVQKNGEQRVVRLPPSPVNEVGAMERMVVEIHHKGGANNLLSAQIKLISNQGKATSTSSCANV